MTKESTKNPTPLTKLNTKGAGKGDGDSLKLHQTVARTGKVKGDVSKGPKIKKMDGSSGGDCSGG